MFEQLKTVYITPTKIIRVRFRYKLPSNQKKVLAYTLEIAQIQSYTLNVHDFLLSVLENILTPFILLQNHSVVWETVSITYPMKPNKSNDLLKLPLLNVRGFINKKLDPSGLGIVNVSVRFKGKPLPFNTKVYGIDMFNINENLLPGCSQIYEKEHFVDNTNVSYKVVFIDIKNGTLNKKQTIMALTTTNKI